MVAITVILAAVIAAFVLDLGGSVSEEAQAGVTIEVDQEADQLTVEVTSLGNSDYVNVTGDLRDESDSSSSSGTYEDTWSGVKSEMTELQVGETVTFGGTSDADVQMRTSADTGTATVVAVIEEDGTETQVASQDYDLDWS
jgi:FlaG/FlaF family flagellin (archaellin)